MYRLSWQKPRRTTDHNAWQNTYKDAVRIRRVYDQKKGKDKRLQYLQDMAEKYCDKLSLCELHSIHPHYFGDTRKDYYAEYIRALADRAIADEHSKKGRQEWSEACNMTIRRWIVDSLLAHNEQENLETVRRHFLRQDYVGYHPDIAWIRKVMPACLEQKRSVVIVGERGVGKGRLVSAVHDSHHGYARREDKGARLHTIAMATLTEELAHSELFGHVAHSYTDAKKDKTGIMEIASKHEETVYLDDLPETSKRVQGKLLTALEEGDIRRLGEPEVAIQIGGRDNRKFPLFCSAQPSRLDRVRADLHDRLAVMAFEIPPLSHRGCDVAFLSSHFLRRAAVRHGLKGEEGELPELHVDAMKVVLQEEWPGGVRELDVAMDRVAFLRRVFSQSQDADDIKEEELRSAMSNSNPKADSGQREPDMAQLQGWAVALANSYGRTTRKQLAEEAGVEPRVASRIFQDLVRKGVVKRHGKGRGVYYVLAEPSGLGSEGS